MPTPARLSVLAAVAAAAAGLFPDPARSQNQDAVRTVEAVRRFARA